MKRKYSFQDFNNELTRIEVNLLLDPNTSADLSLLREIYQSLIILTPEYVYIPEETDEQFWKRCIKFSQYLSNFR